MTFHIEKRPKDFTPANKGHIVNRRNTSKNRIKRVSNSKSIRRNTRNLLLF